MASKKKSETEYGFVGATMDMINHNVSTQLTLEEVQRTIILPPQKFVDKSIKSRGWSITINNPTQEDVEALTSEPFEYLIFQFEIGNEQNTLHIQGFIYYKSLRVWPKKRFPRAHLEKVKSISAIIKYCSKEETRCTLPGSGPFEYGTRPIQGQRSDLEELASQTLDFTIPMKSIAADNPTSFIRYGRGLITLRNIVADPRTTKPKVYWFWGDSAAGKTSAAIQLAGEGKTYYVKDSSMWWDNYTFEDVIVIDDYDINKFPYRELLRLLDRYKYQGQVKGGYTQINSPYIAITCDRHPKDFWVENEYAQIVRRLDAIRHVTTAPNRPLVLPPEEHSVYNEDGSITWISEAPLPVPRAPEDAFIMRNTNPNIGRQ